jgi:hypothetical protein
VDVPARCNASRRPGHDELDGPAREAVELVQSGGRPSEDEGRRAEVEQPSHELLLPRARRSDDAKDPSAQSLVATAVQPMADLRRGQTRGKRLVEGRATVLARGGMEQLLIR